MFRADILAMDNNNGVSPNFSFDLSSLATHATSLSSVDDIEVIGVVMDLVHRAAAVTSSVPS